MANIVKKPLTLKQFTDGRISGSQPYEKAGYVPKYGAHFDGTTGYLSKAFSTSGSLTKHTISILVARDNFPSDQVWIIKGGSDYGYRFLANQTLQGVTNAVNPITTNAVFRDTSFDHFVFVWDTTQGIDSDRLTVYRKGVKITSFSATNYPALNALSGLFSATVHYVGSYNSTPLYGFNGRIADFHAIDGQSLAPTDFGEFNAYGDWVLKEYEGSYGPQGFHLKFDDNSNLGKDSSGNGNHWTVNGAVEQINVDINERAVHLEVLAPSTSVTYSNEFLTATTSTTRQHLRANQKLPTTGITKWEVTVDASRTAYSCFGIQEADANITSSPNYQYPYFVYGFNDQAQKVTNGTPTSITSPADKLNINLEFNADTGILSYYAGDVLVSTITGLTGEYIPYFGIETPVEMDVRFKSDSFIFFDPDQNVELQIQNPVPNRDLLSSRFVQLQDTEDNISASLAAARSGWTSYIEYLHVRGSIESGIFRFSHDSGNEYAITLNNSAYQSARSLTGANNWIGWAARTDAGYNMKSGASSHTNGVATTITHNFNIERCVIFLFDRAGTVNYVYHSNLTAGNLLKYPQNNAQAALTNIANVTANSFDIGSGNTTGTYDYFIMCEDEYNLIFGFEGNANLDNMFVSMNTTPEIAIIRNSDAADQYYQFDRVRNPYNPMDTWLEFSRGEAEGTGSSLIVDMISGGLKGRGTYFNNTWIGFGWGNPNHKHRIDWGQ